MAEIVEWLTQSNTDGKVVEHTSIAACYHLKQQKTINNEFLVGSVSNLVYLAHHLFELYSVYWENWVDQNPDILA